MYPERSKKPLVSAEITFRTSYGMYNPATSYGMKLKVGQKAPDFKLPDQNGKLHSLTENKGSWILIYFYPKDDTPGCTKEACMIRNTLPDFKKLKCTVFGISVDSIKSHKKFADKYKLSFTLLADEKKETVKKYNVWAKKTFMGKSYMGTRRTSFLIGPDGRIKKIYENVKPELHAQEVLDDLKIGLKFSKNLIGLDNK